MFWTVLWVAMGLGALLGLALLGLRLWRSAKALLAQLEETTAVLEQLQARIEELEAQRASGEPFAPAVIADDAQREQWRAVRAANLQQRALRRRTRRQRTRERWHYQGLPS